MSKACFVLPEQEIIGRANKSQSGNIIELNGGLVQSGEAVSYIENVAGNASTKVGQVVAIDDRRDIKKKELIACKQQIKGHYKERLVLLRRFILVEGKRPDACKYTNVPDSLLEVALTCQLEWVPIASIQSLAFVFHIDAVQEGKYICGGMSNAYFIRESIDENKVSTAVEEGRYNSFGWPLVADEPIETYSKRIWNGRSALMELCHRAMSSRAKWDGRNKHIHMLGGNYELFSYLKSQVEKDCGALVIKDSFQYKRAKKRLNADLSVSNKRMKTQGHLVRLLDQDSLDSFRSSIGSSFAVANTAAVPTMKEIREGKKSDTVHLKEHDLVRIVTCRLEDKDTDSDREQSPCPITSEDVFEDTPINNLRSRKKQPRLLPFPGLDLEFLQSETGLTDVHLNLKFKKLYGGDTAVKTLQSRCYNGAITEEDNILGVGDQFVSGGFAYEIVSLEDDGQLAKCVRCGYEDEGVALEIGAVEATDLVREYLEKQ